MLKPKRILIIADFKNSETHAIRIQSRMWVKGFQRLGHDVLTFSYRDILRQCCNLPGKKIAQLLAKPKVDRLLVEITKKYYPDIVIFFGFIKGFDIDIAKTMRQVAPEAVFISRAEDPSPEKYPHHTEIAKQTDILTTTSEGRFMQTYLDGGVKKCLFIPNMCDPDIHYNYDIDDKYKADLIFTGKPEHKSTGGNDQRYEIVEKLCKMQNAKVYGAWGVPNVEGIDYFRAISSAKIGLSINAFNDVKLYHSDRLINYLACGTFVLAKRVPDSELLFKDGIHLKYFDETEEFFELAKWYLEHDNERKKIADAGMNWAHEQFNCVKIAGYILDVIENGAYNAPWNSTV